jgi:hypothetical protein
MNAVVTIGAKVFTSPTRTNNRTTRVISTREYIGTLFGPR